MRNESNEKQRRFKLPADWPRTEAATAQPRRDQRHFGGNGCLTTADAFKGSRRTTFSAARGCISLLATHRRVSPNAAWLLRDLRRSLQPLRQKNCRRSLSNVNCFQMPFQDGRSQLALIYNKDPHMTEVSVVVDDGCDTLSCLSGGGCFPLASQTCSESFRSDVQLTFADLSNRNAAS